MRTVFYLLLPLLLWIAFTAQAIVTRHDVDDTQYLASWEAFPPLAQFYVDGAHGVLIAPTWVVTAAHTTFCTDPNSTILVGGKKVKVKARYVHPGHRPGVSHDLALLELNEAVNGVTPARLYSGQGELGTVVTFIGAGGTGNGLSGQTIDNAANAGVLRKANNRVEKVDGPLLQFVFHRGQEALPLEGIGGGGDSGGPAFISDNAGYQVLGVSSRGEIGSTIGKYGNREYYTRLQYFKGWITQVIEGNDEQRSAIAMPKLTYLVPGLSEEILPQVCQEIGIFPDQR